jgi:hypothetical protein
MIKHVRLPEELSQYSLGSVLLRGLGQFELNGGAISNS